MPVIVEATPQQMAEPSLPKADPCSVIIFGASGDLTKRKLVPALYTLHLAGSLCEDFHILGVGQDELSDEKFRDSMHEGVIAAHEENTISSDQWRSFAERMFYMRGELTEQATYETIADRLKSFQLKEGERANRLFYFSTPPSLAPSIVQGLGAAGLAKEDLGWSRIIVEKPFGRDLKSASQLNREIAKIFSESQVYRIDHYLGKETVQNLMVFRFGNSLFEPVWNRNYIEFVEITAAETLGVGRRAGYYEEAGALRDMVGNHMLQLLTMTAMEPPVAFDADSVREQKVQVLRSIHPMGEQQVAEWTVRGQYGAGRSDGESVPAYREEEGVAKDSATETYVALKFDICNWRWADVPFFLRTGKRLAKPVTEIAVHFRRTPQALFSRTRDDLIEPNVIVIRIQPEEGITLTFGAKRPGPEMRTGTVHMDFSYQSGFGVKSPEAYVTLLLDAMRGDATLFIRDDMVEAQWRLITPIEDAWAKQPPPHFPNYGAGSEGPEQADELLARSGLAWRPLGGL